jgi:hypothetical protein
MSEIYIESLTGDNININIAGRTYPQEIDKWDGNWLNTKIKIRAGKFSGKIDALLRSDELEHLSKDIRLFLQEKKGNVLFSPIEPWLIFHIGKNKVRNFVLAGEITDTLGTGNTLKFSYECSLPLLEKMLSNINDALEMFPAK